MLRRGTLLIVSLVLALCCGATLAMAWSNGPADSSGKAGYGYGTHDWILEHAIDLLGEPPKRGASKIEATVYEIDRKRLSEKGSEVLPPVKAAQRSERDPQVAQELKVLRGLVRRMK